MPNAQLVVEVKSLVLIILSDGELDIFVSCHCLSFCILVFMLSVFLLDALPAVYALSLASLTIFCFPCRPLVLLALFQELSGGLRCSMCL